MGTLRPALVCVLLFAPVWARAASEDEAGDVSEVDKDRLGPLRERIRPVSGHLFLKKGRFEASPSATVSLKDAFVTKYLLGATLTYHPLESFGIGARFGYAIPTVSGAAQLCERGADGVTVRCRNPTYAEVDGPAPGNVSFIIGVDGQWAPLYGKIAAVSEAFLHFDIYGIAGLSAVGYRGPSVSVKTAKPEFTVGGNVGVGMRFFINEWMTVRTELRDLIYVENIVPVPTNSLRNQLLFELGFSMFFPTVFTEA